MTPAARADYWDMSQSYGMMATDNFNAAQFYANQNFNVNVASDVLESGKSKNSERKSSRPIRRTPKKVLTTTTYRESSAVRTRVLKGFTGWIATQTNATDAASIRRDFEDDVLGRWAKEVKMDGLKRGDVADAMTDYWVKNWMIANRVTFTNRAQVQGVRRFFASALASTPAFAKATDAQRQEMAEGFIYNAILQGSVFAQVFHTGNKALIKQISDARAAQFKKETGLDLRTMKLTDAGFAAKT